MNPSVLFAIAVLVNSNVALRWMQSTARQRTVGLKARGSEISINDDSGLEPMFSISYDPLEPPTQVMMERDLQDHLLERSLRYFDDSTVRTQETCFLVGLEDRSLNEHNDCTRFTMEESLTELSELAGAAGLAVVGSTYQRVQRPSIEYYIGQGKTKDIQRSMSKLRCTCVIFDAELTPSQQKNLELALNQDKHQAQIKVIDRTALILDIFAQHARTKEGQLQVQLAMLSYRLPRLTNMWSHLERQSAGSKGRSNGGVGLRGPGEKQLESDRRQMKTKISLLNAAIDGVRRHRSQHRSRRRQLGVPVIALVGYTNAGKSSLLNLLTSASVGGAGAEGVFAADMLFATLDPTTRLVRLPGTTFPDLLMTDTVGFVQKLPTNLVAAFRATLEELAEADLLLHVTDIQNAAWRKQEAAVLRELSAMGLDDKPLVTVWNKIDLAADRKEFLKFEAAKRPNTVALSCQSGEGVTELLEALQRSVSSQMEAFECLLPYDSCSDVLGTIYNLCSLDEIVHSDAGVHLRGRAPSFLVSQLHEINDAASRGEGGDDDMSVYFDNKAVGLAEALDDEMTKIRIGTSERSEILAVRGWHVELGVDTEDEFSIAVPNGSGSGSSSKSVKTARAIVNRSSPTALSISGVSGTVVVRPTQQHEAVVKTKLRPRVDSLNTAVGRSPRNGKKGKAKRRNENQDSWAPEFEDLAEQGLNADGLIEFQDY